MPEAADAWAYEPDSAVADVGTSTLRIYTLRDLKDEPDRDYLLKGLMAPAEMSVWYGPPKCGKSFLLCYIVYGIAQGRSVFGRRVKDCPVLYVAAEGAGGYSRRITALSNAHGDAPGWNMILQPVDLLHPFGDVDAIISAIKRCGARLIVLDTLARVLAGGDENSPADMGAFISMVDRVRSQTGAHVAIVHHGGKDASRGMRGHSGLLGAADLVVEVTASDDGPHIARITHAKDDASGDHLAFTLDVVMLGTDADGDPRTTCLVRESDPRAERILNPRLPPAPKRALDLLHNTIAGPRGGSLPVGEGFPPTVRGCREDDWYAECETQRLSNAKTKKDRNRARGAAVGKLKDARLVAFRDGWVWPVREQGDEGIKGDRTGINPLPPPWRGGDEGITLTGCDPPIPPHPPASRHVHVLCRARASAGWRTRDER